MKRIAMLLPGVVLTAGTRKASLKKQDRAMLQNESSVANDQARDTAVKRARGNV